MPTSPDQRAHMASQDPSIRWVKVRDSDGWVVLHLNDVSEIHKIAANGYKLRMLSGSMLLLTKREAQKVIRRLLPEGMQP